MLAGIAGDASQERMSIGDLLALLRDRALPALLLVFALPNVLAVPGTSVILGIPLVFLAAQLALGTRPWLPRAIAERSIARADFARLIDRAAPWLARAERLLRPRWRRLAVPPCENAIGIVCLLLAVIVVLPIPLGNALPALAICMFALGLLERDGVWIAAGLVATLASLALVWGMGWAVLGSASLLFADGLFN